MRQERIGGEYANGEVQREGEVGKGGEEVHSRMLMEKGESVDEWYG